MRSLLTFIRDLTILTILSAIFGFLARLGDVWSLFSDKPLAQWLAEHGWTGISVEVLQRTSLVLFIVLVCLLFYVTVMGVKAVYKAIMERQRKQREETKEQRLEPDVWLYDAIHYVAFGSWEGPDKEIDGAEYFSIIVDAIQKMLQKARDGALPIWGRQVLAGPGTTSRINPDYWAPSQLDVHGPHGFFKGNKEEFRASTPGPITYRYLKTNKSQVEKLWRSAGAAHS